jgi:hypothetical protein
MKIAPTQRLAAEYNWTRGRIHSARRVAVSMAQICRMSHSFVHTLDAMFASMLEHHDEVYKIRKDALKNGRVCTL